MAPFSLRPHAVLFVAALSIPVVASGACGSRTACIEYSQAEYAAAGSCLSAADALATFSSQGCPGSIVSVNGPGTFDGEICCYPVTYDSVVQSCGTGTGTGPFPPGGPGTGFTTTGFQTTTQINTTTTTTFECVSCNAAIVLGGAPCSETASNNYAALQSCAGCNPVLGDGGAPCLGLCASICGNAPIPNDCQSCMQSSCAAAWNACQGS